MVESPTRVALRQDRARSTTQPELASSGATSVEATEAPSVGAGAPPRRRLNPKAAWPYVIGLAIFALEAIFIV